MTLVQSPVLAAFDSSAQAEIRTLVRANQARTALERLRGYEPRDRSQGIQFYGLRAFALEHLGESRMAVEDWVRALHRTSRTRENRTRVRVCLSDSLSRVGDLARTERILLRCLAEAQTKPDSHDEALVLAGLGRVHMRRGTLTLAARFCERAMALDPEGTADPPAWVGRRIALVHALTRLGEFHRAASVLKEIEDSGRSLDLHERAAHLLTWVTLSLEAEDVPASRAALARVDHGVIGDHIRYQLIFLQYTGAVHVAEEHYSDALGPLEEALAMGRTTPAHDDTMAEVGRLRATALLGLDRPDEALECARQALRAGRGSDMLDRPAGLRVEARCLAALGRIDEAKSRLAAALAELVTTEFYVERRRLHRDMERLGMRLPGAQERIPEPSPPAASSPGAHAIALSDGRRFVTSDRELMERIRGAAETRLPVLIEGETGTGKERVARLLHELGSAREGPFVVVDCTTLSETLAEAELFGVTRGAYTGASSDRHGLVGAANGGTLLFDELPHLSLSAQSKLLRLLQEGTYRRLGEARTRNVAVRVVATTNQDTERLLACGTLKPDLFFRLHGHRIRLRPLRERLADVVLLAEEFARAEGLAGIRPAAVTRLSASAWPGNARQLEMLIRVAAAAIGPGHWLEEAVVSRLLDDAPHLPGPSPERIRLQLALDQHEGNVAATARALNMSRQGLYKALRRNGLM